MARDTRIARTQFAGGARFLKICLATILGIGATGIVSAQNQLQPTKEQGLQMIRQARLTNVTIVNHDDAPIKILSARSRTISPELYHAITGDPAPATAMTSKPGLVLQSTSGKIITSFGVFLTHGPDMRAITHSGTRLGPGAKVVIKRNEWELQFFQNPGKAISTAWDLWLSGSTRGIVVEISDVTFDDGTRWDMPDTSGVSRPNDSRGAQSHAAMLRQVALRSRRSAGPASSQARCLHIFLLGVH